MLQLALVSPIKGEQMALKVASRHDRDGCLWKSGNRTDDTISLRLSGLTGLKLVCFMNERGGGGGWTHINISDTNESICSLSLVFVMVDDLLIYSRMIKNEDSGSRNLRSKDSFYHP